MNDQNRNELAVATFDLEGLQRALNAERSEANSPVGFDGGGRIRLVNGNATPDTGVSLRKRRAWY